MALFKQYRIFNEELGLWCQRPYMGYWSSFPTAFEYAMKYPYIGARLVQRSMKKSGIDSYLIPVEVGENE